MEKLLTFLLVISIWISHIEAVSTKFERLKRNAFKDRKRLWPNGVVPVVFDSSLSAEEKGHVINAMVAIHRVSCIRFVYRGNQNGYITVRRGSGCSAVVGYTGQQQNVNLGNGCFGRGTIIHELMHALGFFHEHNRPDRDEYITVVHGNIKTGSHHNFEKKQWHMVTTLGERYDPYSVMHYRAGDFSIAGRGPSLISRKQGMTIAPSGGLTATDVRKLNKLYQCK